MKENHEDVIAAIEKLGELPREEGQPSFPDIGTILAVAGVMRVARHNREKYQPCHKDGCSFDGYKRIKIGEGTFDYEIVECDCRKAFYARGE
jgi:hypothetical protein